MLRSGPHDVVPMAAPKSRPARLDDHMRILVVEDSPRMAQSLKKGLSEECYAVDHAEDGETGLSMARTGNYDLVLLDINLPKLDGFSVMRALRARRSDVPVIMLTARDAVKDRVEGLDHGADDYLTKPFALEELFARIRAIIRRPGARAETVLRYEDLELDPAGGQAIRNGRRLQLSAREFTLLRVFMSNPDAVIPRSRIFESAWNIEYEAGSNVVEVYINYLRNKLEEDGSKRLIHTVRGRGYLFGKNV